MPHISAPEIARSSARAAALGRAGRHAEAVMAWERLHRRAPDHPIVAAGLGAALLEAGRAADAQAWLLRAADRHPSEPQILQLLADALARAGERQAAVGVLLLALELDPDLPGLQSDLARALYRDSALDAALPHAARAFAADPATPAAALLTTILVDLGRRDEALDVVAAALRAGAKRADMLLLRSMILQMLGRNADAIAVAREALALEPGRDDLRHNLAAGLLLAGHMTPEAWAHYEGRVCFLKNWSWPAPERRWTGQDVRGKTVALHAEQGLGDTIQFARYAPLVAARGARVVLVVQRALVPLLEGMDGVDAVVAAGGEAPAFDLYCPLLSLPGIFGTALDTIPPAVPLGPSAGPRAGQGLQVGLVWAGNPNFVDDRRRSVDPALLRPLAEIPDVTFHGLQLGADPLPLPGMRDALAGARDFADTAARIAPLDLVIAVDTAVAHLAATMAKPVWLLARHQGCWRWQAEGDTSAWYPTMRIYRQDGSADWRPVIRRVCDDLRDAADYAVPSSVVEATIRSHIPYAIASSALIQ